MKIYLKEILETERSLDFSSQEDWVRQSVAKVDEKDQGDLLPELQGRAIEYHVKLRKLDHLYEVAGNSKAPIQLYCSRCGEPFVQPCESRFALLFTQDSDLAGLAQIDPSTGRLSGKRQGHALHSVESLDNSYDITHLTEDFIDLGDVLTEQIQLQVPFQPLCRNDCKGVCPVCGVDQNRQSCGCEKSVRNRPFAQLEKRGDL